MVSQLVPTVSGLDTQELLTLGTCQIRFYVGAHLIRLPADPMPQISVPSWERLTIVVINKGTEEVRILVTHMDEMIRQEAIAPSFAFQRVLDSGAGPYCVTVIPGVGKTQPFHFRIAHVY